MVYITATAAGSHVKSAQSPTWISFSKKVFPVTEHSFDM